MQNWPEKSYNGANPNRSVHQWAANNYSYKGAMLFLCHYMHQQFKINMNENALIIRTTELKSIQRITISHFSAMCSVCKSIWVNLDLSTHLWPINSNAFF